MGLPTELEESKRKILALPVYRALMAKAQMDGKIQMNLVNLNWNSYLHLGI
jgi:hypothetical protein